jgi:hypothetical protein
MSRASPVVLCSVGDPACAPCWVFVFPPLPSDVPRVLKGDDMASAVLTLHFCSMHDLLFCPALHAWRSCSQVQIEHTLGKALRLTESACPRCMTRTTAALHTQWPKLFPASVPRKASGF